MDCCWCDPTKYPYVSRDQPVNRLVDEDNFTYVIVPRESHVKHHLLVFLKANEGKHKKGLIDCTEQDLIHLGRTIAGWCRILKEHLGYNTVYSGCYSDAGHVHFHLLPLKRPEDKPRDGNAMQWLAEKESASDRNKFDKMTDAQKTVRLEEILAVVAELKGAVPG